MPARQGACITASSPKGRSLHDICFRLLGWSWWLGAQPSVFRWLGFWWKWPAATYEKGVSPWGGLAARANAYFTLLTITGRLARRMRGTLRRQAAPDSAAPKGPTNATCVSVSHGGTPLGTLRRRRGGMAGAKEPGAPQETVSTSPSYMPRTLIHSTCRVR